MLQLIDEYPQRRWSTQAVLVQNLQKLALLGVLLTRRYLGNRYWAKVLACFVFAATIPSKVRLVLDHDRFLALSQRGPFKIQILAARCFVDNIDFTTKGSLNIVRKTYNNMTA
jgi:hypothetical protein